MTGKTNQRRESVKSVDVDCRLADIFSSRRSSTQESRDGSESEVFAPTSASSDLNWLNQFIASTPPESTTEKEDHSNPAFIEVIKSEVRSFWSSPDDKMFISMWKKSRAALAKDCQKQRKAAIRKSIRT